MAKLNESLFVRCPYHRARGYLAAGIGRRLGSNAPLTLRVPLSGVELKKDVIVTFTPGIDPMHMDQPWRVHWTPEGGGPYPDFDGELTVRADDDYMNCMLELVGEYAPPGGALGKSFDLVVGSRIAALTARALLERLGEEFVALYKEEESQKSSPS